MESNLLPETRVIYSEPQAQRRRLLQTAFAVTAGGGLQSLASSDAFAQSEKPPSSHQHRMASPMRDAIKACLDCHSMCLETAMNFCLVRGGRHVEQQHFRLMINCAELCQTSANFMLRAAGR